MEQIGAFGLTEPDVGSAISAGLATSARRDGDGWVLNGAKKWIGNASFADLVIIWARDTDDGEVKGFVVEKGSEGMTCEVQQDKMALRVVQNAEITLQDVFVPETHRLARAESFASTSDVLRVTRMGVAWQADRLRPRRLRARGALHQVARAVRAAHRGLPAGAGPARQDALQRHRLHGDERPGLPAPGRREPPRRARVAVQGALDGPDARDRRAGRARSSAATASCSSTTSVASSPTPRPSTPTRARARSTP